MSEQDMKLHQASRTQSGAHGNAATAKFAIESHTATFAPSRRHLLSFLSFYAGSSGGVQLVKNKAYLVLLLCMGSVIATFTCVSSLLEQILCVQGYDDVRTLCKRPEVN